MSHASVLVAVAPTSDVEAAVAREMAPFDENGDWFGDGSRWDWWEIGGRFSGLLCPTDVMRRGDVDLAALGRAREAALRAAFAKAKREAAKDPSFPVAMVYGVEPDETVEQYLARRTGGHPFPAHYAFLHDRAWNESERMGWFGSRVRAECAVANTDGVCLYEKKGAKVVSWNQPHDEADWPGKFYERFVEPLPPDTLLVTVDYHV